MTKETPTIEKVLVKAERKTPMVVVAEDRIVLYKRRGIEGDVNADPISPRQVLLVEAETLETHGLSYGALRENIVTRHGDLHTLETGTEMAIGSEVTLRITFPCEACNFIAALNVSQPRMLVNNRGLLAVVLTDGTIRVGDEMRNLGKNFPQVPTQIYERFIWLINQIPAGTVIDYTTLIKVIGGSSSYLRAIPSFIKKARAGNLNVPLHRIVTSTGNLISYVDDPDTSLVQEGIVIENNAVNLARYRWDTAEIYYQRNSCFPSFSFKMNSTCRLRTNV